MARLKIGHCIGVGSIMCFALSFIISAVCTERQADDESTLELPPPVTVEETVRQMDMTFY